MQLEQCLLESGTSHLRAIAAYRKIEFHPNPSRAEVLSVLRDRLSGLTRDDKEFCGLNAWEREILNQVSDAGGVIPASDLEKSWGSDDPEVDRRWFWHKTVSRGLARLRLAGFLYCVRDPGADEPVYAFPDEYRSILAMERIAVSNSDYAPYQYCTTGYAILTDMYHLLQYIEEYRVRSLRTGKLAKRHKPLIAAKLDRLTPVCRTRDEAYIDLLYSLATGMGFIIQRKSGLAVDRCVSEWFSRSQFLQMKDLFEIWLENEEPDDAIVLSGVLVKSAGLRHPWRRVKRAVLGLVEILPDNWVTIDEVAMLMQSNRPHFYRSDYAEGLWQLIDRISRVPVQPGEIWDHLEKSVIRYLMTEPLAWLGLLETGLDRNGHWEGVIVSRIGRCLLSGSCGQLEDQTSDVQTPLNKLIVQADFDVLAPAGMVLAVRDRLEKIADFVAGGHLQRYRISRSSVATALETGLTADDIIEFLETASSSGLPQNVKRSLQDWIDEFGKIEIRSGIVMTTEDEYILHEVMTQPSTARLIGDRIGPQASWIEKECCSALVNELKRIGYMPRLLTGTDGELASISLKLDSEEAEYLFTLLNDKLQSVPGITGPNEKRKIQRLLERIGCALADGSR
ncbi:helicase-associated domain-containing protein [bacterium]|nr:helicase-associated domain-containing protein [candidate division CSSED10-310 bacterium]